MKIEQTALVGTLESSDVQITLSQGPGGIDMLLDSEVAAEYGDQIKTVVRQVLDAYGIADATVQIVDKGALDCTIRARVTAAVQRAIGKPNDPEWEVIAHV
jgi:citrate lyase subunit gamma (acyl carrier protein)